MSGKGFSRKSLIRRTAEKTGYDIKLVNKVETAYIKGIIDSLNGIALDKSKFIIVSRKPYIGLQVDFKKYYRYYDKVAKTRKKHIMKKALENAIEKGMLKKNELNYINKQLTKNVKQKRKKK